MNTPRLLSRTTRRLPIARTTNITRRHGSTTTTTPQPPAAHHTSHSHHSASPTGGNESIPAWVYLSTASLLAIYGLYAYIMPPHPTALTRFLTPNPEAEKADEERANRHTRLVEEAGKDKQLFYGSIGRPGYDVRFPERLNVQSPYNNVAGQTRGVLLEQVQEHFDRIYPKD